MFGRLCSNLSAAADWPLNMVMLHFRTRKFELAMTMAMLGEAILLFFSPQSIEASAFRFMLQAMTVQTMFVMFLLFGLARIIALILNGNWMPWGAYVRALGALIGAFMWAQMDAALFMLPDMTRTPMSPGVPVYTILALFELISMYEALAGAKKYNDRATSGHC